MSRAVEQIKERLSIVDVLSLYLKLEKSGINYKTRCPFHNEKTASFFVSPERQSYYCFGCGAKGDIFSFVETFEGLDFKGALKSLADRAGVTLDGNVSTISHDEKDTLFKLMELATEFYQKELLKNSEVLSYLEKRGLTQESIQTFRIGYAPEAWRNLSDILIRQGYTENLLEQVGLIKRHEKGIYDRFRGRVIFPIMDTTGRVIAFSGRTLSSDEHVPKYLNSPDTILFDKSSTLYGIDRAKEEIRKRDYSILVEGQFDLILAHQTGTHNTVCASGTALSDEAPSGDRGIANLRMLARLSKNIVFAFDGDKAGIAATYRGALLALPLGMDVKIASLPTGVDPAELILTNKENWLHTLKHTKHAVIFFTEHILKTIPDERERIARISKIVLPLVVKIESALDQEHFLSRIHQLTGLSLDALRTDVQKLRMQSERDITPQLVVTPLSESKRSLSDRLFGILFWQSRLPEPHIDNNALEIQLKRLFGDERFITIRDGAFEQQDELIFEAEAVYTSDAVLQKEVTLLIQQLEMNEIRRTLESLTQLIRTYEKEGTDTSELLAKVKEHTHNLERIQSKLYAT